MKKFISLFLVIALVFSLAACASKGDEIVDSNNQDSTSTSEEGSVNDKNDATNPPEVHYDNITGDYSEDYLKLEDVDLSQYDSFENTEINAKKLFEQFGSQFQDGPNIAVHFEIDLTSSYTLDGVQYNRALTAKEHYINADDNNHGFITINDGDTNSTTYAVEYYYFHSQSSLYYKTTVDGIENQWEFAGEEAAWEIYNELHIETSGGNAEADVIVKNDGNGHYVYKTNTTHFFNGELSEFEETQDVETFYVVEEDLSAFRMYVKGAKLIDSIYEETASDIDSNVDIFYVMYDVNKVNPKHIELPVELLDVKPSDTDASSDDGMPAGPSKVYIDDLADVLTPEEEVSMLEGFVEQFFDMGYGVLFLTVSSHNEDTLEQFVSKTLEARFDEDIPKIAFVFDKANNQLMIKTIDIPDTLLNQADIDDAIANAAQYVESKDYMSSLTWIGSCCVGVLCGN